MVGSDHNYRAFLVRLWRDGDGGPWRVMLEDAHTGEAQGFASMTQLYTFLEEQAASEESSGSTDPGASSPGR